MAVKHYSNCMGNVDYYSSLYLIWLLFIRAYCFIENHVAVSDGMKQCDVFSDVIYDLRPSTVSVILVLCCLQA